MAKTIEDLTAEISGIDDKIKKLSAKRGALRAKIQEIENSEILELAKKIKSSGKLAAVEKLISQSEGS